MGHLDELQEKYEEQGLSVLAITREPVSRVEDFIDKTGAKHPIVIESGNSMRAFGRTSYPSAFLLGPDARILWVGHPGSLKDEQVEEALGNVKLLPEFPKKLSAVQKSMGKDKLADAVKKTEIALAGTLTDEERAAAEQILEWLKWFGESTLEGAAADLRNGKYYESWRAYDEMADTFKGHEYGKTAKDAAAGIMSDKTQKLEVKAGQKFAKIRAAIVTLTPKKALKELKPLLAKKYEETAAGIKAAEMAAEYEKALEAK